MSDSFALRLRDARIAKGYSQTDLASMAGIAPGQVNRYEARKNSPRPHVLAKLAAALGVAPEWLATGQGDRDAQYLSATPLQKSEDGGYMFSVKLSVDQAKAVTDAAAAHKMTPGAYLKRLVFEELDRQLTSPSSKYSSAEIEAIAAEVKRLLDKQQK